MVKINKEKFSQYESVREGGLTNMFDVRQVVELSDDLTKEEILDIMKNYRKYTKEFGKETD